MSTQGVYVQADYNRITGNATQGLILAQLMYWMKRRTYWFQREKYIVKTMAELANEIGLKTDTVRKGVKKLESLGFIKKAVATEFGKKHSFIKVNLKKVWTLIWEMRKGKQTEKSPDANGKIATNSPDQTEKSPLFGIRDYIFRDFYQRL